MDIQQKMNLIANHLQDRLPEFTLEHLGDIFDTGNHFVRFYRTGQGVRVEFTRVVLEDCSAYDIIERLRSWTPPPASQENVGRC